MSSSLSWLISACGLAGVIACLLLVRKKPSWKILSRCIGFLLLAAALSCGIINDFGEWAVGKPRRIVVVLDRSASMGARIEGNPSLLEQAIAQIKTSIEKNSHVEWMILDSATKSQIPIDDLDQLESTETAANFPELIWQASSISEIKNTTNSELWVFSDMQESNWTLNRNRNKNGAGRAEQNAKPFPRHQVRVISLRERPSSNLSIRCDSSSVIEGNLALSFTISQTGIPHGVSLPLSIQTGDKIMKETISLPPEKTAHFERIIPLPCGTQSGFGSISIAHDDATFDDTAYFAFSTQPQPGVTIACQSKQIAETLGNMVSPPGAEEIKTSTYRTWSSDPLELEGQSLLIWQGIPPNTKQKEEIEAFMQKGGYTLFLPDRNQSKPLSLWNGLKWLSPDVKSSGASFTISPHVQNRGILRRGKDLTPLPFHHVKSIRKIPFVGEGLRSLAQWDDGTDAILSSPVGKGGMIICTTLPIYSWSNLADGSILIPLIHRLAGMGTRIQTGTFSFPVGSSKLPAVTDNQMACLLPLNHHARSPFLHTGVFRTGDSTFCTNRPIREDDAAQIYPEHLGSLFPETHVSEYSIATLKKTHPCRVIPWWYWGIMSILLLVIPELSFTRKK